MGFKKRTKIQAPFFQPLGKAESPGATAVTVLEKDASGSVLRATGTTVPATEAGYAKGCLFIDTDVAAGTTGLYENIGDTAASNFNAIGAITAGEITLATGSVLLGTAGIAAALDAKTNGQILVGNTTTVTSVAVSGDATLASTGALTVTGSTGGFDVGTTFTTASTTTSSGAGAVAITGTIHEITTTGTGDALTLVDGVEGQWLAVVYAAETAGADTAILTPTTLAGSDTTITFSNVGDTVYLLFTNAAWQIIGRKRVNLATGDTFDDSNGNEMMEFTVTASAVNHFGVSNAGTGEGPALAATGTDANIDIEILPKGTGIVHVLSEDAGAAGATLALNQESATPVSGDKVGIIEFKGFDAGLAEQIYAKIDGEIQAATGGAEQGNLNIYVADGGAGTVSQAARVGHSGTNGQLHVGDGGTSGQILSLGAQDLELVTTFGSNKGILLLPDGDGPIVLGSAIYHTDVTSTSGAGAIALNGRIHEVTTTGTGDAMTLANAASSGQRLTVLYVAETAGGDTAVITPTTLAGGSTITLNNLGDSAELVYSSTGGWYVVGLGGAAAVA